MSESIYENEKFKKRYWFIAIDEVVIFILGIIIFYNSCFYNYRLYYIGFVILWYWMKIRHVESKIFKKEQEIYNVYFEKCKPIPQNFIDAQTRKARDPLNHELNQMKNQQKFLVEKFVVINLIVIVLIQIFW